MTKKASRKARCAAKSCNQFVVRDDRCKEHWIELVTMNVEEPVKSKEVSTSD